MSSEQRAAGSINVDVLDRDPALDGVRGFALSMVLIGHWVRVNPTDPLTNFIYTSMESLQISLDLFFVLSGFLITSILIRTRDTSGYFANFYARRVLRIFPAYYLLLAGVFLLRPLLFGAPPWQAAMEQEAGWYLLYAQNILMAWRGEGLAWSGLYHTFSLAIEEQFYLVWPLLIWFTPKHRLLRVCLLLCAGSLTIKLAMYGAGHSWWTLYASPLPRLHALAAGGALAAWMGIHKGHRPPGWLRTVGAISGVCLVLEVVARSLGWISVITHSVLLNVTAMPFFAWSLFEVIAATGVSPVRRLMEAGPLTFLGRYSYGMYLLHIPLLKEIRTAYLPELVDVMGLHRALLLTGFIGISIAMLLAIAMYHAVELPILRLKRYFVPKKSQLAKAADAPTESRA